MDGFGDFEPMYCSMRGSESLWLIYDLGKRKL